MLEGHLLIWIDSVQIPDFPLVHATDLREQA